MATPKPFRRSLGRALSRMRERRDELQAGALMERVRNAPALRDVKARQEAIVGMEVPAGVRRRLREAGFTTTPKVGRDFRADLRKGRRRTEVPIRRGRIPPQGRSLQATLKHEVGHQVLKERGVPVEKHHPLVQQAALAGAAGRRVRRAVRKAVRGR